MQKRLRPMGNSYGFVVTKTMLEYMEVNPVLDNVEVIFDNKSIVIKKGKKEVKGS